MKIAILTNEDPPYIYGGAGVHVEYLVQELAQLESHGGANAGILPGIDKGREQWTSIGGNSVQIG